MLMLHKGCRKVARADLADIPVPEASGRHLPVPHHVLADTVVATAEGLGLPLRKESWGISNDGMRLFGAIDFDPIAKLRMPEGTGPSLGIRHANDKSISVQLTAGARVFLCDNGVMVGEIETVRRKHTTGLHLDALIREALTEYLARLPDFGRMHDELTNSRLTSVRAKALIHDAFLAEHVMATKYLPAVSETYFKSKEHRRMFPRKNRWKLYNAFTETFKQESVTLQADSFRALGRALCTKHN
ncbi:MAG: DUF932 domain-containing protein [Planctomycetota bacterium]